MITAQINDDGTVDRTGIQGDLWAWTIPLFEDAACTIPFPLTNRGVRGQIRKTHSSSVVAATIEASITGDDDNIISCKVGATKTALVKCGETVGDDASQYVYDVEVFDPNDADNVFKAQRGSFFVKPESTK